MYSILPETFRGATNGSKDLNMFVYRENLKKKLT
jgi:hypothetical protein